MHPHKLPNYLKSHRKKIGFTQEEIAFLLGCKSKAKITLYEHFKREPSLHTAFLFEAIYSVPASALLAGIFEKEREKIRKRAKVFLEELERNRSDPHRDAKVKALHRILFDQ